MNKRNYQKEMEKILEQCRNTEKIPTLLLHSCCAPCSSYVLEYLSDYFEITVFYYNPNIYPEPEYRMRVIEQQRLISAMRCRHPVHFAQGEYEKERFHEITAGMEEMKEGGTRCFRCYELRLREAAKEAQKGGFDYFATTLSISPMKNAEKLNEIGERLGAEYGISYLSSDFKKRNGYKRSIELSQKYGLYRQDYCGCQFSLESREKQKMNLAK